MNTKVLTRREFLKAVALTGAGISLAACAPKAETTAPAEAEITQAPPPKEGVLLRYWTGWGGEGYSSFWDQVIAMDGFKQILGNNTFEYKVSVGEEPLLTAVAGGDPPDTAANINYLGFMARDVLMPVDDLVAASTSTKKDNFIEGNWGLTFYKGKQYGIPSQECFLRFGLNYNTKLVEAAGLDPNNPPRTWDELLDWHIKLTKKDDAGNVTVIGVNPYGAMGEGFWDSDGWLVATSWNDDWFNTDTGKFNLNNEKLVDAFKTFKKFVDVVGPDNLVALYSVEGRDTWGGAYNAEAEAMIIEGYWHPGETSHDKPEVAKYNKASWAPVPTSRKDVKSQGAGGHMWSVFKGSKDAGTMFKIGEFLNTKDPCDILWKNQGWLPAVKSYISSVDPSVYPGLDFYFKSMTEATE